MRPTKPLTQRLYEVLLDDLERRLFAEQSSASPYTSGEAGALVDRMADRWIRMQADANREWEICP